MAIKKLKELRKVSGEEIKETFYRYIVFGHDLFSLRAYLYLRETHGDEVALVWHEPLTESDLTFQGPRPLRGEANVAMFKELFPEVALKETEKVPVFFKEQKFRSFGGRSKSETLLHGESFFTVPYADFDVKEAIPLLKEEGLLERVNGQLVSCLVTNVEKKTSQELIEGQKWALTCSHGEVLFCEHLVWGGGPHKFLGLFGRKEQLSDNVIEFCEHVRPPHSLHVKLSWPKNITERKETLFLPLSYTHEWGHFIGEFHDIEGGQSAEFVHFLDAEHTNEEQISKIIRIFKRNLEKIFEQAEGVEPSEFIKLTDETPCLNFDVSLESKAIHDLKNLHFVSFNAPLEGLIEASDSFEYSSKDLSHFVRGELSLKALQRVL